MTQPTITAVVFEIDNGDTVTRVEDTSPEIISAWYNLNAAVSASDADSAFYTLEDLYIRKYGTDCHFAGEVVEEAR